MEVANQAAMSARRTSSAMVGGVAVCMGVTALFPLTYERDFWWGGVCGVWAAASFLAAGLGLREATKVALMSACVALVLRIGMSDLYVSGSSLPAFLPRSLVGRGWDVWFEGDRLMLRGLDGLTVMRVDMPKFCLWELAAALLVPLVTVYISHGSVRPAAVVAISSLWILLFGARFVVLAAGVASSPGSLVSKEVSLLRVFWEPAGVIPVVLVWATAVAWGIGPLVGEKPCVT